MKKEKTMILMDRLEKLKSMPLLNGAHSDLESGFCAMEAAAWIAGEPWSDHPQCVCPIIGAFMRSWNDGLPTDADRDRLLKDLVPLTVGTVDDAKKEKRAFMCIDWVVRVFTPAWLEMFPDLHVNAAALRILPGITSWESLISATPVLVDAQKKAAAALDAALDAARAAALDAARDAAWDAARAAALDAARDAAWAAARAAALDAALDAARAAARAAAWDAARDAARDAALDGLKPTTEKLQLSAQDLVRRMCAA